MIHITSHAISRYRERVEALPEAEVRRRLMSPAVQLAVQIGAPFVKLGTGQRIVIDGCRVVTVLPARSTVSGLRSERDVVHGRVG